MRNLLDAEDATIDSVGSGYLALDSLTLINEIGTALLDDGAALNMAMADLVSILSGIDFVLHYWLRRLWVLILHDGGEVYYWSKT